MSIGLGLRQPHYQHVIENDTLVKWFEVHSENYFLQENVARKVLLEVRNSYPISLHGIGLSLGSAEGVNTLHLQRLKELVNFIDPFLLSEHLSWNNINNKYFPDLFPLPYTDEALQIICNNIDMVQNYLKQNIILENPSSYIEYHISTMSEVDFLLEICKITGAKILLDINNLFVSCTNHGWDANKYLLNIPFNMVAEMHLAGHSIQYLDSTTSLRIDTHNSPVCQEVWDLYALAIAKFSHCPTLIEWDTNIPEFKVLEQEALKAMEYQC